MTIEQIQEGIKRYKKELETDLEPHVEMVTRGNLQFLTQMLNEKVLNDDSMSINEKMDILGIW